MQQTEKIIGTTTILALAALVRFRFANFLGGHATAGQAVLGVPVSSFDIGEQAGIATQGEILVEAGAAYAVGVELESDATGRAILRTTGAFAGRARDAASAAGVVVRVSR
jgi:hypothetical protein